MLRCQNWNVATIQSICRSCFKANPSRMRSASQLSSPQSDWAMSAVTSWTLEVTATSFFGKHTKISQFGSFAPPGRREVFTLSFWAKVYYKCSSYYIYIYIFKQIKNTYSFLSFRNKPNVLLDTNFAKCTVLCWIFMSYSSISRGQFKMFKMLTCYIRFKIISFHQETCS